MAFFDEDNKGWFVLARQTLQRVQDWVGSRKVIAVDMDEDSCGESDPCQHDGPLIVTVEGDEKLQIDDASSVEAGVVQAHYFPRKETHFTEYAEGFSEWTAKKQ